jgi:S-adenosylmethionine:tRNA ribosyltransferase-isomerase
LDLSGFDYDLPEDLIAQYPLEDRAASRMLVLDRASRRWEDRAFREFPQFVRAGDCLALNDTRVFPSRLLGRRGGVHALPVGKKNPRRHEHLSGEVEVFLLRPVSEDGREWESLVRPGRKMAVGERIRFPGGLEAEIVTRGEHGERIVRFDEGGDLYEWFDRIGHVPLPPYIKRRDTPADRTRYQTVFARERGSAAAPTAGLHFTPEILEACRRSGGDIAYLTLHVGLGTFQPLHEGQERLHAESFALDEENAAKLRAAARIIAVGSTSLRTLETVAAREGGLRAARGETDLFIRPGYEFRAVGALLTNFHLPRTSLLVLVCAFAGTELTLAAYGHAVASRYRFFSYGDCMLIV